jgi:fatty acid desaturase
MRTNNNINTNTTLTGINAVRVYVFAIPVIALSFAAVYTKGVQSFIIIGILGVWVIFGGIPFLRDISVHGGRGRPDLNNPTDNAAVRGAMDEQHKSYTEWRR